MATTASKAWSSNGSASADSDRNSMSGDRPPGLGEHRVGESIPTTEAPRARAPAAAVPVPVPTSSTRVPSPTSAAVNSGSTASPVSRSIPVAVAGSQRDQVACSKAATSAGVKVVVMVAPPCVGYAATLRDCGTAVPLRGPPVARPWPTRPAGALASSVGAMSLWVQLLGPAQVVVAGRARSPCDPPCGPGPADLAYAGGWVPRDRLAFLFWPDTADTTARHNLRQLLKRIRRLEWLTGLDVDADRVRWPVLTDVAAL